MKEGWKTLKIEDICEILDAQRKPVSKKDRHSGCYPYYGATGIQDYVDAYIFDGRYLLVGEDGAKWGASDRTAFIVEGKCWVNNHAHILKLNHNVVDTFVEYYLTFKDLNEYITGAIVPKLTQQALRGIPIPIPPLSEQEGIVAELDCLSDVIEKQKRQLKELDNLAQAIFYDMFGDPITNEKGWKVKPLGDACGFQQGEQVPIEEQFEVYEEGMVRFLRIVDFTQGNEKPRYVMCKNTKHILQNEQVAIVRYGTPGFVCFGKSGLIANNLFKIIPKSEDIAFRFLVYWLYSDAFQSVIKDNQYGVALQAIKFSTIKDINLIIPPINLQQEFASKIEAIEKQKELIKQSLSETETLFNSRMDYYFN